MKTHKRAAAYKAILSSRSERDKAPTVIDVIVEGGVIQDIIGIPKGVTVRTIDYDIEGSDPDRLSPSPCGDGECILGEWK